MDHNKRFLITTESEEENSISLFFRLFLGGIFALAGLALLLFHIPFFGVEIFMNNFFTITLGIILFTTGIVFVAFKEKRHLHFFWISLGIASLVFFIYILNTSWLYFFPFGLSVTLGFVALTKASHYEDPIT